MKTILLFLVLLTSGFTTQIQAQSRIIVNTRNPKISDNLDLRVVASIFGDSRNLIDFEMKLNNPKLQISNLDLNNDGFVDYLRVIEQVTNRNHVVIIQSIVDRDIYQDIATIEIEKNRRNIARILIAGNSYFYGQNYIYEPIFRNRPIIYASLCVANYQPYCSNWNWNFYPPHYYSWHTSPLFRYQNNVNVCLNNYHENQYIHTGNHRSVYFSNSYTKNSFNRYERQHLEYSSSRKNTSVVNSYESENQRNKINRESSNKVDYLQNNTNRDRALESQNPSNRRDYSQNKTQEPRESIAQRTTQRNYSISINDTPREPIVQSRAYSRENYYCRN